LKVHTRGYQGKIWKRAKVYSNDPNNNLETLSIQASVKVSIHLSTRYIYLRGQAGQVVTRTVTITAKEEKKLQLVPTLSNLNEKVTYSIEEVEPGKIFKVRFSSIPGVVGTHRGFLQLKTNYPEKPEINIQIRTKFSKEKQVTPKGKN
jgi:hypothetical protein